VVTSAVSIGKTFPLTGIALNDKSTGVFSAPLALCQLTAGLETKPLVAFIWGFIDRRVLKARRMKRKENNQNAPAVSPD